MPQHFRGTISATSKTYNADNPIYFGAYGEGNRPQIRGGKAVEGFTHESNSIWHASDNDFPDLPYISALTIDDQFYEIGKMPETGFYSTTSDMSDNQLLNTNLALSNLEGSIAVIRTNAWTSEKKNIVSQTGTTLIIEDSPMYSVEKGEGYIIINHSSLLNQNGDWSYDPSTHSLYVYYDRDIGQKHIEIAIHDDIIDLTRSSNIVIENLEFRYFNDRAINVERADGIKINNCRFSLGSYGVKGFSYWKGKVDVTNSEFDQIWSSAILLNGYGAKIKNNQLTNICSLHTMYGKLSNNNFQAIYVFNSIHPVLIKNNYIYNVGYNGIRFSDNSITEVDSNYIENYCLILGDGAAIYTYKNDSIAYIRNNIVKNGMNNPSGLQPGRESPAGGIYLDEKSDKVFVIGNTVDHAYFGLELHDTKTNWIRDNKFFDIYKSGIYVADDILGGYVRNNTYYSENTIIYPNGGTSFVSVRLTTIGN